MPSCTSTPFNRFTLDHINIRGFTSHRTELQAHLDLNGPKPQLLAINETWLQRSVEEIAVGGYTLVSRLDRRDGRAGGGIALFALPTVASSVTLLEHAGDESHERSWLAIHADLGPVLLCIWYRPPHHGEVASIDAFESEWRRLSSGYLGSLVVGDLNAHHSHWLKFSDSVSVEGSRLLRFCHDNGFRQLVRDPTHEAGSTLDLVLTDLGEIESTTVLPRIADHNVARVVLNLDVPRELPRAREVLDYKKASWNKISGELASADWSFIEFMGVDDATLHWTELQYIPGITIRAESG